MRATPRTRHASAPRSETAALPRFLLPALIALAFAGAVAPAAAGGRPVPGTALDVSVSTTYDARGGPAAVVHVRVPHRGLVFTRDGDGFVSVLQVAVVAERDGRRVGGGFAEATARADAFEATGSDERLACDVTVALAGEGRVELALTARVRGTERVWRTDLRFDPGVGSGVPWYFAGFDWNVPAGAPAPAAADTLRAAVTLVRHPGAGAQDSPPPTSLIFRVTDAGGDERVIGREELPAAAADTLRRRLKTPAASLPFGPLRLDVSLETGAGHRLDLAPGRDLVNLRVDWRDDAAWRLHVDWLDGFLDGEARRALASLPVDARPAAWRAVWAARPAGEFSDEIPDEATHLMRIVEADRRFGQFGRGALSDRGRVHIQRGPPDSVEAQVMDLSYPGQWEVWYYRRDGVLYRFYDAYGLGDFRLYDTAPY